MIKLKDWFTFGNLLGGVIAVLFCIEGRLAAACYTVIFAYGFDVLDGIVARLTGGGNKFGAELDNLSDYVTFTLAPSFVLYLAYRPLGDVGVGPLRVPLGGLLAGLVAVAGTIRHVRNLVFDVPTRLVWVGMPRPAAGMLIVGFVQSSLWRAAWGPKLGLALVPAVAWAIVGTHPCVNHRGRAFQWWVRGFVALWVGTWLVTLLWLRAWFWDAVVFFIAGYFAIGWRALTGDERRAYFATLREWKARIARESSPVPQPEQPATKAVGT